MIFKADEIFYTTQVNSGETKYSKEVDMTTAEGYAVEVSHAGLGVGEVRLEATISRTDWFEIPNSRHELSTNYEALLYNIKRTIYYDYIRLVVIGTSGSFNIVARYTKAGD